MSGPVRPDHELPPCQLEPITCWPLLLGALGFVAVGILAFAGLAGAAALRSLWNGGTADTRPAFIEDVATNVIAKPRPEFREEIPAALPKKPEPAPVKRTVVQAEFLIMPQEDRPPVKQEHLKMPGVSFEKATAVGKGQNQPPSHWLSDSEIELSVQLWRDTPELDIRTQPETVRKLFTDGLDAQTKLRAAAKSGKSEKDLTQTSVIRKFLASRTDLEGLPLLGESVCQMPADAAKVLQQVSTLTRRKLFRPGIRTRLMSHTSVGTRCIDVADVLRDIEESTKRENRCHLVRPFHQILQPESSNDREVVVKLFARTAGAEATQAPARMAVFDLSPSVRDRAILALGSKELETARPTFLAALQHPWPAAAQNAAIALANLVDRGAVPKLKKLAEAPDPCAPFQDENKDWRVRELVRVNHLRNCLLCHPPSSSHSDLVRASIPTPGERIPEDYSGRARGDAIRADVVYLRQDFSLMHQVEKAPPWPEIQRFDYLVRTRKLSRDEIKGIELHGNGAAQSKTFPQREAVLFALAALEKSKGSR